MTSKRTVPEYSERLVAARLQRGWSGRRAAKELGVAESTYRNAERGRAFPGVFKRVEDVYGADGSAIREAWRAHRELSGQLDATATGVLPTLGNAVTVGTGDLGTLEDRHNYVRVAEFAATVDSPQVIIGSPYLRYWLDSHDECRLERLMKRLPNLTAEVVMFETEEPDHEPLAKRLTDLGDRFADRLTASISSRPSDLSYITYEFDGGASVLRRLLIGLQITDYSERPFIELVSERDDLDVVTRAVLAYHRSVIAGAAKGPRL